MDNCIFCRVALGQEKTKLLYKSDDVIAFDDKYPSASIHILIVPKKHIPTFMEIAPEDAEIIVHMAQAAQHLIRDRDLVRRAYRMIFNGGRLIHVAHLHWHLISSES